MNATDGPAMKSSIGIWIGLLSIAGFEVFLTYRQFSTHELLAALLLLAILEATLGLLYFMHLKFERPVMMWSFFVSVVFVLLMMNHLWPDAHRMLKIGIH
ncbi:MAG: cytochrome C oxidase subunit IV family protein [Candidatus Acidiferrales bacterium]